jgi:hypothetical protein
MYRNTAEFKTTWNTIDIAQLLRCPFHIRRTLSSASSLEPRPCFCRARSLLHRQRRSRGYFEAHRKSASSRYMCHSVYLNWRIRGSYLAGWNSIPRVSFLICAYLATLLIPQPVFLGRLFIKYPFKIFLSIQSTYNFQTRKMTWAVIHKQLHILTSLYPHTYFTLIMVYKNV